MSTLIDRLGGHGLLVVFLNVLVEQIGVPLPAEPSLVVAGSLTVSGRLHVHELFGMSIAGMLIADSTWYLLGRCFGSPLLNLVSRLFRGREVRLGLRSIALTKFIPGGMVAPALAGAMSYSFWQFVANDLLAATLWSSVWIVPGLVFHDQVADVLRVLDQLWAPMLVVAAVIGAAFAIWKARVPLSRLVGRLGSGVTSLFHQMSVDRDASRSSRWWSHGFEEHTPRRHRIGSVTCLCRADGGAGPCAEELRFGHPGHRSSGRARPPPAPPRAVR